MAPGMSGFGTRSGTIDSQAGVLSDHAALSAKVVRSSSSGEAKLSETRAAKSAISAAIV